MTDTRTIPQQAATSQPAPTGGIVGFAEQPAAPVGAHSPQYQALLDLFCGNEERNKGNHAASIVMLLAAFSFLIERANVGLDDIDARVSEILASACGTGVGTPDVPARCGIVFKTLRSA